MDAHTQTEQAQFAKAGERKRAAKADKPVSDVKAGAEPEHVAVPLGNGKKAKRVWPAPGTPEYSVLTPMEKAHATRAHRGPGKPEDRPKYLVFGRKTGGTAVYLIAELPTSARALRWVEDCRMLLDAHYDRVEIRRAKVYKIVKGD